MNDNVLPELFDKQQAAEYLGISQRTLDSLISRKELPAIKVGRQVRISTDEISLFLTKNSTVGETIEPEILYNRPEKAPDDDQA